MKKWQKKKTTFAYTNEEILNEDYFYNNRTIRFVYIIGIIVFILPLLFHFIFKSSNLIHLLLIFVPIGSIILLWTNYQTYKKQSQSELSYIDVKNHSIKFHIPYRQGNRKKVFDETIRKKDIQYIAISFEQKDFAESFAKKYISSKKDIEKVDQLFYLIERRFYDTTIHPICLDQYENKFHMLKLFKDLNLPIYFTPYVFRFENEREYREVFITKRQLIPIKRMNTFYTFQDDLWKDFLTDLVLIWQNEFPNDFAYEKRIDG